MKELATVVIVGRTNVGKSSLFNRLATSVKSLTFDYEGITRDFLRDTVCWQGVCFDLIDTGGISFKKSEDPLMEQARNVALSMVENADALVFVVDGSAGPLPEDREIAKMLHKKGKPVILVVNKIDVKSAKENLFEFERLGFGNPLAVSCQHGIGIGDLLELIVDKLPIKVEAIADSKPKCKVVLLGKPNVGKSSLLNLLLKQERAIVSQVPGTTREAISERIVFHQEDIQVTDTPGIRKKRAVNEPIESLMVKSSLRALQDADIVLLLVDSSEGQLSDQELKLAFYAFTELHKSLIILFNKQDLVDESLKKYLEHQLAPYAHLMDKVERLEISCKTEKNIGKIIPLVSEVWKRSTQQFSASDLTVLFQEAMTRRPLYHKTQLLKLFRVRQVKEAPITLLLIVNVPVWFGTSQLGFLDNVLRKAYELKGVPVKYIPRTN
jgi:GTP-binding protein